MNSPDYTIGAFPATDGTKLVKERIHGAIWEDILDHLCTNCQRETDCEAGYEPDSIVCAKHDAYKVIDEQVEVLAHNIVHPVVPVTNEEAA